MSVPESRSAETLRKLVVDGGKSRFGRRPRLAVLGAATVLISLALFGVFGGDGAGDAPRYRTVAAHTGDLVINVSANGNLQPTNSVDVGSELSGIVESVHVDVNDRVRKGQVIARLDPSKLKDQVRQARADLASARARLRQAEATVAETAAALGRLKEVARLSGGKVPSRAELDAGEASSLRAVADQGAAQAAVASATAALSTQEISLSKTIIHSPIDGIVLTRKVEPGQTVAAAMTAPVLFTLAEDLRRMELQVDVDEADVGKVKEGQDARFHVDAWPGETFPARVVRVGWGSQTKDQVVSYLTILEVKNDALMLRPGMTATAEITTARRGGVLLVPNAALRFSPPAGQAAARRSVLASLMPRPPAPPPKAVSEVAARDGTRTVWHLRDGQPQPVRVKVLGSNGQVAEVRAAEGEVPLQPGMELIVEALVAGK